MDAKTAKACGTSMITKVDWQGTDDQPLSVPSFCGEMAKLMAYLCENRESFKTEVKSINTVE